MTSPDDADGAEALALEMLTFLGADSTRLNRFLDLTGLSPARIGTEIGTPRFALSVLDYVLAYEPLLLDFCRAAGHDPADIAPARDQLARSTKQLTEFDPNDP